jgi:plasminogen activator
MNRFVRISATLCVGASAAAWALQPTGASAGGSIKDGPEARWERGGFSISTSIGVMNGEANEYVFDPSNGRTISQLIWKFDNNVVLNGGAAWRPAHWLTLGMMGRINLTDSSTMDDFDFNIPGCPPVAGGGTLCHSHHDDTRLKKAHMVDLYAAGTFYRLHGWAFSGLAGYRWEEYKWQAFGGTANYTVLPPGLGITYEQWWEAPYVGLEAKGEWDKWVVSGRVIGSWWVDSRDRDNHHLRTILFTEEFGRSDMVGVNVRFGYKILPNLLFTVDYDYEDWDLAKGPTTATNYSTGATAVFPGDSAGADNHSHTVSAGFKYKF